MMWKPVSPGRLFSLLLICGMVSACNIPAGTPAPTATLNTIQTAFAIATITGAAYTPAFGPPGIVQPFPMDQTQTAQIPVTGGTPAPSTPPPASTATWPVHQLGNQGPEVFAIQCLLRQHGYTNAADGIFGSETQNAVLNFQTQRGLEPNGIVDERTFPALIQVGALEKGQEGEAVRAVQRLLRAKFMYPIVSSGVYNEQTDAAVRDFQSTRGLIVDGIVGPQTWQALFAP